MTNLFTQETGTYHAGIHVPLIRELGDCSAITRVRVDRYSKSDPDSMDSQVERHNFLYPDDPDVIEYRRLIETGIFDGSGAEDPRVGRLSPADVHHLAQNRKQAITFARIGRTLFLRVTLSAAQREIRREDGSQANVYTELLLALLTLIDGLTEVCWGVDITRAARDEVNWTMLMRRHRERNVAMVFAGHRYDLTVSGERMQLQILGAVTAEDDPTRRRRLVEGKITRYLRGEPCLPPELIPYGWTLPTNRRGVVPQGTLPVGQPEVCEALREFHRMHAQGATNREMVSRLAELERDGKISRRSGLKHNYTFADALTSRDEHAAVTSVVARMIRSLPSKAFPMALAPDQEAIDAYVAGGEPASLFDLPQRIAIARIEALRTGTYLRVLRNDIKQRGLVLGGVRAVSFDPQDECGFFFIEAPWPFPVDPVTGEEMARFAIPDEVLRKSAARVLMSLGRGHRGKEGGRAHRRAMRRPFMNFGRWQDDQYAYEVVASPGAREGLVNSVILRRDASETGSWSPQRRFHSKSAIATVRQQSLSVAVADAISAAVIDRLQDVDTAHMEDFDSGPAGDRTIAEREHLLSRSASARSEAEEAARTADGARQMASLLMESGDITRALAYEEDAAAHTKRGAALHAQAARLRRQADQVVRNAHSHAQSDLSVTAYLVAGLQRAAESAKVPDGVGRVADRLLTNWRLILEESTDDMGGRWITFSVDLHVPLADGGDDLVVPLTGRVPNVRSLRRTMNPGSLRPRYAGLWRGPRTGHAATLYLRDGQPLDRVAVATRIAPHVLVKNDLRKWLDHHGMNCTPLRTALIDHPLPVVRQVMYQALSGVDAGPDLSGYNTRWRDHIRETYLDESMTWGYGACPDDLLLTHQVLETVRLNGPVAAADLVRVLGVEHRIIRQLVTPAKPNIQVGVKRPKYLDWADKRRRAVTRIVCPHRGCDGYATRAVLLPETAASGFGVICVKCRRMPNTTDPKWASIVFPVEYAETLWTACSERPRPVVGRTVAIDPPAPLSTAPVEVKRRYPNRVRRARRDVD